MTCTDSLGRDATWKWSIRPARCAQKLFILPGISKCSYTISMTWYNISKIRDFYISCLKQIKWFRVDLYFKPFKAHLIPMLSARCLLQHFMWINTLIWKFKLQARYTPILSHMENTSRFSSVVALLRHWPAKFCHNTCNQYILESSVQFYLN